ncbi:hypothetical protein FE257_006168 [Aspergillus nanangensis]|uniref:Uncharacterized protein n=1 Tax=Aspergillus nanangensis TaxID=2582783 RepID=A0AAD4CPC5_ASPNN|nr:hypothetical protein FE257_006168 [Aspergillus nanangensis]
MPKEQEPEPLPTTVAEWEEEMAKDLKGQTIHGKTLASASKIGRKQFLLFRVIWKKGKVKKLPQMLPGLNDCILKADKMLETYTSWNTYCRGLESASAKIEEGNFAMAHHYQREVENTENDMNKAALTIPIAHRTRARAREREKQRADAHLETPSKPPSDLPDAFGTSNLEDTSFVDPTAISEIPTTPVTPIAVTPTPKMTFSVPLRPKTPTTPTTSTKEDPSPFQEQTPAAKELESVLSPPTKDEQIVNCALILFLNALTIPSQFNLTHNWTLHRKAFKAEFDTASFEARVDGYLDDRQGKAKVIIEVKPVIRSKKLGPIRMQESAQMVAWIKEDDEEPNGAEKMRIIVSQDRHEVFLTVAKYNDDYIQYLKCPENLSQPLSFMTMREFGPWAISNDKAMKNLGSTLLAISLFAEGNNTANF